MPKPEIIKDTVHTQNSEYIKVNCPNDLKGQSISGGPQSPI